MGAKVSRRLLAVVMTLIMIMTSAAAVFAADSPEEGATEQKVVTTVNASKGTITVKDGKSAKYRKAGAKKWKKASNGKIKGLKKGGLYQVKVSKKTVYRFIAKSSIKSAKGSKGKVKVTWKKTKKASKYTIFVYDKSGKLVKKTTSTKLSKTIKGLKKGTYKVAVRPMKKKGGKSYLGQISAKKKVTVK